MPGKSSVPSRKRPTATSSAAMSAADARGPAIPASRAIRSAGKRASSGARKSRRAAAMRSGAAAGEGSLPPDLLGRLLRQVGQIQRPVLSPRGLTVSGLTEREVAVVRLLADGFDTAEIAGRLYYSERTVKNIIHDITSRLELRNRTHAVAYAIREGLI